MLRLCIALRAALVAAHALNDTEQGDQPDDCLLYPSAPALMTAEILGLPLLIMKKQRSKILQDGLIQTEVTSFTKGTKYQLTASRAYIQPGDRVLVIDDFLAFGEAALGACSIIEQAGATVVGIGAVIEKAFQPGHERLVSLGYNLCSLARVSHMEPGVIEFVD